MILENELYRIKNILRPEIFNDLLKGSDYQLWIEISEEVDLNDFSEKIKAYILETRTVQHEFELYLAQDRLDKRRKIKFIP